MQSPDLTASDVGDDSFLRRKCAEYAAEFVRTRRVSMGPQFIADVAAGSDDPRRGSADANNAVRFLSFSAGKQANDLKNARRATRTARTLSELQEAHARFRNTVNRIESWTDKAIRVLASAQLRNMRRAACVDHRPRSRCAGVVRSAVRTPSRRRATATVGSGSDDPHLDGSDPPPAAVTFETAAAADGPSLVAFLESLGPDVLHKVRRDRDGKLDEATDRALREWRKGARVEFFRVDEVLNRLGLHPSLAPQSIWRMTTRRRPGENKAQLKLASVPTADSGEARLNMALAGLAVAA